MKEKREWHNTKMLNLKTKKRKGDMAKLVDATDLIGLSLGMETY